MKLGLATDFGSPAHWRRLVDFARAHDVQRLVFWGDYTHLGFDPPLLYPRYSPGLLSDDRRRAVQVLRDRITYAAELTAAAGMEFWYTYQVLMLPPGQHVRELLPELFNAAGEPDMAGPAVYQFIRDQLDELLALVPSLAGVELWVMECANVAIAHLRHQPIGTPEICRRVVDTVHDYLSAHGKAMVLDLHTASGDPVTRAGLKDAAAARPDIILSADNTFGDFQLLLPFNPVLIDVATAARLASPASGANPFQVNFDVNGEYWGRNFVPTSALGQYARHIETARQLRAVQVTGRISTGHDRWSPHANILPSRRHLYPSLADVRDDRPFPPAQDLEVNSTDTLGAFNARFFCRRVHNPAVQAVDVLREFLVEQFGPPAAALVPVFLAIEELNGRIFYTDITYFGAQSVLPDERLIEYFVTDEHLTRPSGSHIPPDDLPPPTLGCDRSAFTAACAVPDYRTPGPAAIVAAHNRSVADAQALLADVTAASHPLAPADQTFLLRQLEDLVFFARAFALLTEALTHYFHQARGVRTDGFPDPARLRAVVAEIRNDLLPAWDRRYPADRYQLAQRLRRWLPRLEQSPQA